MSHQSTVIIELASRVSDSNCSANTLVKERQVLEINGNGVQRDLDKRSELKASTDAYLGHLECADSVCSTLAQALERQVKETDRQLDLLANVRRAKSETDWYVAQQPKLCSAQVAAAQSYSCNEGHSRPSTPFHGTRAPPIPISDYLIRIAQHSKCSPVCFIMAFVYIQRLTKKDERLRPCSRSVHRLLISGILIATKLVDDKFFSNSYHAKIGGIATSELNALELTMLKMLDFRACVSRQQMLQELQGMVTSLGLPEERRRSKKRVSEHDSASVLPAKMQHDLRHTQVLVTPACQTQLTS